jgi:excisionase family DNA binding protein
MDTRNVITLDGARLDDLPDPVSINDLPNLEIYTVPQVAHMLNMTAGTVYQLLRNGTIPARRLDRRWLISRRRFHDWLDDLPRGA